MSRRAIGGVMLAVVIAIAIAIGIAIGTGGGGQESDTATESGTGTRTETDTSASAPASPPAPGSPAPPPVGPGSGSPAPGSPAPGSPAPGSPVPGSPVPGSPVPGSSASAPTLSPRPDDEPRPPATGRIAPERIRDAVREAIPQLQFCFEWQLSRRPELAGRVTLEFRITEDGSVADASIAEDLLEDEVVLRCFRGVFERMRFDPPPEGGEVLVRYPIAVAADPEPEGI